MVRSMDSMTPPLLLLFFFFFFFFIQIFTTHSSTIPSKYDGFIYPSGGGGGGSGCEESSPPPPISIDAFFDPLCPDCRDAWAPLEKALQYYTPRVSLTLHPFPLPYHDNAFLACRALHIAHRLNSSAAYNLLQAFFDYQERYSNSLTSEMSRTSIVNDMAKFAARALGKSLPMFQSGFKDPKTDAATRVSFKYGCSRGVTGTPYFFVNGFALPGSGSALDYETWRSIIDPLLESLQGRSEQALFEF